MPRHLAHADTALSQRLAATTAHEPAAPDPRPRTIAIIRAGGSHMPDEFIDQLASVFSANASTLVLDGPRAADLLPKGVRSTAPTPRRR